MFINLHNMSSQQKYLYCTMSVWSREWLRQKCVQEIQKLDSFFSLSNLIFALLALDQRTMMFLPLGLSCLDDFLNRIALWWRVGKMYSIIFLSMFLSGVAFRWAQFIYILFIQFHNMSVTTEIPLVYDVHVVHEWLRQKCVQEIQKFDSFFSLGNLIFALLALDQRSMMFLSLGLSCLEDFLDRIA